MENLGIAVERREWSIFFKDIWYLFIPKQKKKKSHRRLIYLRWDLHAGMLILSCHNFKSIKYEGVRLD